MTARTPPVDFTAGGVLVRRTRAMRNTMRIGAVLAALVVAGAAPDAAKAGWGAGVPQSRSPLQGAGATTPRRVLPVTTAPDAPRVVWGATASAPVEPPAPVPEPAPVEPYAPVQSPAPVEPPAPVPEAAPVQEPAPVEPPAPVQEAAPVQEPAPVEPPAPVPEAAPVQEPAPVEPPAPVPEPAPVEPPAPVPEPAPVEAEPPAPEQQPDTVASPPEQQQAAEQTVETVQRAAVVSGAAVNFAGTLQEIWQLQLGCLSHCARTTQRQSTVQQAATEQAGAIVNAAVTIQKVFQFQIGCLLSCLDTQQEQTAVQVVDVSQTATVDEPEPAPARAALGEAELDELALALWDAIAAATAFASIVASNHSTVVQHIVQAQLGCRRDCHGTSAKQSAAQVARTRQSISAESGFTAWLRAQLTAPSPAVNHGATSQRLTMLQVAGCLSRCDGTTQVQGAVQSARTEQHAAARP